MIKRGMLFVADAACRFRTFANVISPIVTRGFHLLTKPKIHEASTPIGNQLNLPNLLVPKTTILSQVAGFKVKGRLRKRCKDCYFVLRQERLYVICPTHPRHKQMAMKARDYKSWILTHATQSKIRPY